MTPPTRSIGSRLMTPMGRSVLALAIGVCQLGGASTPVDRVHPMSHGGVRAGNRLSACRLEPPVGEIGVSHGAPPGDALATPEAYPRRRPSPAPRGALALVARPLPSRREHVSGFAPPTGVAHPDTLLAAISVRGPPHP